MHILKLFLAFKAYFDYALSVGFDLPETQIHHLANFSQGNLLFITLEPCPEFHDVFKRFAAVFEQTYKRFLDLQKAEAQAREAKIEAGIGKSSSARRMAMHKCDELASWLILFLEELTKLHVLPRPLYNYDLRPKNEWIYLVGGRYPLTWFSLFRLVYL